METIHQIYYYMLDSAFPMFDGAFPAAVGPLLFNFSMSLKGFYLGKNNKMGMEFLGGTKSTRALTDNLDSSLPTMRQISLKFAARQQANTYRMNSTLCINARVR